MTNGTRRRLPLPELLIGLLAVAAAVALTGVVVANAVRDVKRARDTITVTGSARVPITADIVHWSLAVSADAVRPQDAVRLLHTRVKAVRRFFGTAGLPASAVKEPPISTQTILLRVHGKRTPAFLLVQRFRVSSSQIDQVEGVAARASDLLAEGVPVSTGGLSYIASKLTAARITALKDAVADAHRRAETIVEGIGGKLGAVKSAQLGVYQVVPRNSTEISDYGINDTTSRDKDVIGVVSVTFRVH